MLKKEDAFQRYLPVRPRPGVVRPDKSFLKETTHIEVHAYYYPKSKAVILSVHPIAVQDGMKSMLLMAPGNTYVHLEPMARIKPKRLQEIGKEIERDLDTDHKGVAWQAVLKAMDAEQLELVPAENPPGLVEPFPERFLEEAARMARTWAEENIGPLQIVKSAVVIDDNAHSPYSYGPEEALAIIFRNCGYTILGEMDAEGTYQPHAQPTVILGAHQKAAS
jgi:hypothetical protein